MATTSDPYAQSVTGRWLPPATFATSRVRLKNGVTKYVFVLLHRCATLTVGVSNCLVFTLMSVVTTNDKQEFYWEPEYVSCSWFAPSVTTGLIGQPQQTPLATQLFVLLCGRTATLGFISR